MSSMDKYKVDLSIESANYLRSVDGSIRKGIYKTLSGLKTSPEDLGKPLRDELSGYRSVRACGRRYRIIFRITSPHVASPAFQQGRVEVALIGIRRDGDRSDVYLVASKLFGGSA